MKISKKYLKKILKFENFSKFSNKEKSKFSKIFKNKTIPHRTIFLKLSNKRTRGAWDPITLFKKFSDPAQYSLISLLCSKLFVQDCRTIITKEIIF